MSEYKLLKPLLGWAKGELFTYEPKWCEWTHKSTGATYNTRGSIGNGEIAMLLDYCAFNLSTILAPKSGKKVK